MDKTIPNILEPIDKKKANECNAVVLAYVGDAVESLFVRTVLATHSTAKSHVLHVKASRIVNATSQSYRAKKVLDILNEDELAIYRRAKNSKVHSSAKNADILDYMSATGLEAVYGYLYLTGETDRLMTILEYTYNDIMEN